MASAPDRQIGEMDGGTALPRKNGELVFEAPWEGRAFGMAIALRDRGLYEWRDFRERLATEIATGQDKRAPSSYYAQWLAALEKIAVEKGFVTREELDRRTGEHPFAKTSEAEP